ncbi:reactivating factor of adenosylcobalamin-dependent ethanolamine ammonia lyase [Hydrogenoanaerobacterium saccharovorans]|uniref:Reactivating factor of Adenosylcobalamin-dependent ethanolamine ammonia lyase n=1 Tax=Hydrogenoanaerobacterium saccharovorans TaxID=474960 RepID=A0A1H7ZHP2_9FIRM|nr:ethanolamine ammonia-lyase reactivating factor EutA [Hydrogenoanaerobacterium saccharovorans]RPF48591.1 reactivating factor of adenosylcobalamin-dependent ethanolamine ammonia lyase [Hydrogenoanaerobacterium saccharovorans]SEM57825.1 Reactivating factor of Adenosylcobalamin-dependent ethanolamine ammonia lyase [Hydrogenoanaerobacterium saccharovorans]
MREVVLSAGIDIGTSTTQLIFSKLTIENLATSYTVPRISIVDKEVIYRSEIYFTPLLSPTEIDADAVKTIVRAEYQKAGIKPSDVKTGAVIITGETARKHNANQVLETLSGLAGDFVVATAGPDLESVLSARGAGADKLSKEKRITVANLDVGGGTSNLAVYSKGVLKGVACLDVGGRLIKVESGKITYIYHKIQELAKQNGIKIEVGAAANTAELRKICTLMAELLAQALHLSPPSEYYNRIFTNDGKELPLDAPIQAVTFSGGVADYVYNPADRDLFKFGDIGIMLGEEIQKNPHFAKVEFLRAAETIRATVVGAGTHTTEISGSTISYAKDKLPIKNIPILKVSQEDEMSLETLTSSIRNQIPLYMPQGKMEQVAIAFSGENRTSFTEIQLLAAAVIDGAQEVIRHEYPIIIIIENDIGKALGHAINVQLKHQKDVICIDGIQTLSGDYIDIGAPIADGRVVPVVIKTLIFNT